MIDENRFHNCVSEFYFYFQCQQKELLRIMLLWTLAWVDRTRGVNRIKDGELHSLDSLNINECA